MILVLRFGLSQAEQYIILNQLVIIDIIDGGYDVHWSPYYSTCAPCLVGFDWIIKLEDENLEDINEALLMKSGMGKHVRIETKHRSKSRSEDHRYLYRDVECRVIKKVVKMFRMDFILFQYSAQQYLVDAGVTCLL